jgi:hypothetical protein
MRLSRHSLLLIALLYMNQQAFCADFVFKAEDQQFWDGTSSIIIAQATDVHHAKEGSVVDFQMILKPLACIAGTFSAAAHPTITVSFSIWVRRHVYPKANDLLLAVIVDDSKLAVPRGGFGIINGTCTFMPDNQPMIVLKDLNDPAIIKVLHNMQAARPTTAPTTQPHRHP